VTRSSLVGHAILIAEDEPLIALDIEEAFSSAGTRTLTARTLADAERILEHERLSAAVVDLALADGTAEALGVRLRQLGIPMVIHSGHDVSGHSEAVFVPKPASPSALVKAITALLQREGASTAAYTDPVLRRIEKELARDEQLFARSQEHMRAILSRLYVTKRVVGDAKKQLAEFKAGAGKD
jgi:DNA-binding response OmpR family regulator